LTPTVVHAGSHSSVHAVFNPAHYFYCIGRAVQQKHSGLVLEKQLAGERDFLIKLPLS
jgi:hypothetical protein